MNNFHLFKFILSLIQIQAFIPQSDSQNNANI